MFLTGHFDSYPLQLWLRSRCNTGSQSFSMSVTAGLGCVRAATYKLVPLGVSVLRCSQRPLDNAWLNMGSLSPSVSLLKLAPEMSDSLTRVNICGERQLLLLQPEG